MSEELLDSELFGHVRGSFTGAYKDKMGRFEAAQGGTLFLDEIGEISHRIQLKLLRVLENKQFERVGSNQTIKADVRIVSATNVDLLQKVREGSFRDDLYYRLKVMNVHLPPLRERKEDIPLLVDHFCFHYSREFSKKITGVTDRVMSLFMHHDWPGNIRELKHAIEHGCLLCPGGNINIDHLPTELLESHEVSLDNLYPSSEELTLEHIEKALREAKGNKSRAAFLLGIHRKTLYRKMHRLGMGLK
jgi:transcriptional regulator with PAS, ATPase and Fis domain